MVVERMGLAQFMDLSTFFTGRGEQKRVHRVSLCCFAKSWLMIIPSALLLRRARALIFCCDLRPTRKTLNVMDGDLILRIVPHGTGEESTVSKKDMLCISKDLGIRRVLQDSAAAGRARNPVPESRGQGVRGRSGVQVLGRYGIWMGSGQWQ